MQAGATILLDWMDDLIRGGLGQIHQFDQAYWQGIASLMVDHKLGSVARRIRRFYPIIQEEPDWFKLVLEEIGQLYLIGKGMLQLDRLPVELQADIKGYAGLFLTKKELLDTVPHERTLIPVGHTYGTEEQLSFRKTWYWSIEDDRFFMELEFIVGASTNYSASPVIGLPLAATYHLYPSMWPQRILVQSKKPTKATYQFKLQGDFSDMVLAYSHALGQNPWMVDFPVAVTSVTILLRRNEILLRDKLGQTLEIEYHHEIGATLSLFSNKKVVDVFGTWDNHVFHLISILADGYLISLSSEKWSK